MKTIPLAVLVIVVVIAASLAARFVFGVGVPKHKLIGQWTWIGPGGPTAKVQGGAAEPLGLTSFGFLPAGHEVVVSWVLLPSRKRPFPLPAQCLYKVDGSTLSMRAPAYTPIFEATGFDVTRTKKETDVTTQFQIQGDNLILSQPQTNKSITLVYTGGPPPTAPKPGGH